MSKRNLAIGFGALFVVMAVIVGVAVGIGHPDVPDGDVALVDADITVPGVSEDGAISQENFDRILLQTAKSQGLDAAPAPSDPQYDALKEQALGQALDIVWITGEAEKQGVEVTDTEVQQQFQTTKDQNFKTEEEYQKFLTDQGLTQDEVIQRVKLQVISTKIENKLTENAPKATDDELQEYYDANKDQFTQPEQRTIRIIQNADAAKVEAAAAALQADDSDANWKKVAAEDSTDPTSKAQGGLREGVTAGSFEQPLDGEIFKAAQGEIVGPIKTPTASYVFQVESVTAEKTQTFDELKDQIKQQLDSTLQQESFTGFVNSYRSYWTSKTFCAPDYVIVRCDNFDGDASPCPDPSLTPQQQQQQVEQQGCPPPVLTVSPAAPGSIVPFTSATAGQPQKPHPPGEDTATAPTSIPGGIIPTG